MGSLLGSIVGFFRELNDASGGYLLPVLVAIFMSLIIWSLYIKWRNKEKLSFGDFWPIIFFTACFIIISYDVLKTKNIFGTTAKFNDCGNLCDAEWLKNANPTKLTITIFDENIDVKTLRGNYGGSVLHFASQLGSPEIVQVLLDFGADVNAVDDINETPLHWVAHKGPIENMKLLIDAGANINARSSDGDRNIDFFAQPIHWAAYLGTSEKVLTLLEAGADPNSLTNKGVSVWDYAQQNEKLLGSDGYIAIKNGQNGKKD